MKEAAEAKVKIYAHKYIDTTFEKPVYIDFRWYEENTRRDKDNIAFAKKFILDALVELGILQGDGWKWMTGFSDSFFIDKDNPRIEIEITEVSK